MKIPKTQRNGRGSILLLGIFALAFVSACGSKTNQANATDAAIRAALQQHLSQQSNLNMAAMDMKVEKITVHGTQAQAQVQFTLKQHNVSMEMLYDLEQQGGTWVVTHSQPAGGPFQHPPMDQAHSPHP